MKYIFLSLLLSCSSCVFAVENIISTSKDRDIKVIGITGLDSSNSIKLVAGKKVIWDCALTWGYPDSATISWSPSSTKVAISVRTTKTSSEVHIFDTYEKLTELPSPDIAMIIRDLNSHILGRFLNVSPLGWADEDTIVLLSQGNLIDSITDGDGALNFKYQITVQISTRRVLSILCLSQHNLNDKNIRQDAVAIP